MNTSITVKVLLALFLGAFLWFVVVSIQTPRAKGPAPVRQELREELLNRAEDVNIKAGNVTIQAAVQETYRNGEIHYQDFTMIQETEERRIVITGKTAQTKSEGTEVKFVEMEGNVHVESSNGLILDTETLNYESAQKRIFSSSPSTFELNDLSGRCDIFLFFTETRYLEADGNVRCRMKLEETDDLGRPQIVNIYGNKVIYDQEGHELNIIGKARIARGSSYMMGKRIDAFLTEDNGQFTDLTILNSEVKEEKNDTENAASEGRETTETQEATSKTSLTHHASGIKTLRAKEMYVTFHTGSDNLIKQILAEGDARMDIAPTSAQLAAGKNEFKKITGETIESLLGEDGKGIETISVSSSDKQKARAEIRPLTKTRKRGKRAKKKETDEPVRIISANTFDVQVNPETNEFDIITMNKDVSLTRGDLVVTGEDGIYDARQEQLNISGKPVLKDKAKRVSAKSMIVSLDIGDLNADGDVESLFYQPDDKNKDAPGIFAIGKELGETLIASGSLRFDYKHNILRFASGVRVTQGSSTIQSNNLDIFQDESRLIAYGSVNAGLNFSSPAQQVDDSDEESEKTDEEETNSNVVSLAGERLEIDKQKHEIRVVKNAQSIQSDMTISALDIRYELSDEDELLRNFARTNVRVDLSNITILGDKAEFLISDDLLIVEGRDVRYIDAGKMEANYNKLEYDLESGTMKFHARADQLVKTKIIQ